MTWRTAVGFARVYGHMSGRKQRVYKSRATGEWTYTDADQPRITVRIGGDVSAKVADALKTFVLHGGYLGRGWSL